MAACRLGILEILDVLRKPVSPEVREEFLFYLGSKLARSKRRIRVGEIGEVAQQVYLQRIVSKCFILIVPGVLN